MRKNAALEQIGVLAAPEFPEELVALELGPIDPFDDFSNVSIEGAQLAGIRTKSLALSQVRLMKLDLTEGFLSRIHGTDVEFKNCNLSNVHMQDTSLWRTVISQSKLSGIQVSKGSFTDVEFRDCRIDFATFSDVTFKHVTFSGCQLRETDFTKTTFDHVRFVDCDLTRGTLGTLTVRRSEMRRCTLAELRGLSELRGIAMEWNDVLRYADLFATELGIDIAGDEAEEPAQ